MTAMLQIADWLKKLGMSEYAERFAENDIDMAVLPDLTDQHLKDLGVSLGHRLKMLRAIRDLSGGHWCCTEWIERNRGFVAKYMGDGVLAYFGYPQAHEHDAERAVRAGLGLVEAVPKLAASADSPLQVRIGIATGLVVVGDLIGAGAAQEQAVVGETPNLAALWGAKTCHAAAR